MLDQGRERIELESLLGEGVQVDSERLRELVMRFMGAEGAGWNATQWSETLFGSAFEERFGLKVQIHREAGPDGHRVFAIRSLTT